MAAKNIVPVQLAPVIISRTLSGVAPAAAQWKESLHRRNH
jgi:hypothetical protein